MTIRTSYSLAVVLLLGSSWSASAFFVHRGPNQGRFSVQITATAEDVSIPYDARTKLAYEAAGSEGDYEEFKEQFEASAVAQVIAKRNEHGDEKLTVTSSPEIVVATAKEEEEEEDKEEDQLSDNMKIADLQKNLNYLKAEQKELEASYQQYLQKMAHEGKSKPIYHREGKIDHYTPGPLFDKETERLQLEIGSIKERIKLTQAKIAEEHRVEQVRQEATDRLANHDAEISLLQTEFQGQLDQAQKETESIQQKGDTEISRLQTEFQGQLDQAQKETEIIQQKADDMSSSLSEKEQEIDALAQKLQEAKTLQEQTRQQAEESLQALESKYTTSLKTTREESAKLLSEKEKEIDSLSNDIHSLVVQLQDEKLNVKGKEAIVASLESELQEKETVLVTLRQERDSLRSLVKQSWSVLKTRFKKKVLRRKDVVAEDAGGEAEAAEEEGDKEQVHGEKVLVRSRTRKSG